MHTLINLIKRHRSIYTYYAFLLSLTFSQLASSNQYNSLIIDQIGYSVYKIAKLYPHYQSDQLDSLIYFDSCLNIPYSVYYIDPVLSDEVEDSINTKTMLSYHQGDYGYRKLGINVSTATATSGTLSLTANTKIYPGPNNNYGQNNALQNYLLLYEHPYRNAKLDIYTFYHIEDSERIYINSNSGENYLNGIRFIFNKGPFSSTMQHSFQVGNIKLDTLDMNYSTFWTKFKAKYQFNNYNLFSTVYAKYHKNDFDNTHFSQSYNNKVLGVEYNKNSLQIIISANHYDDVIYPISMIKYQSNSLLIALGNSRQNWMFYRDSSIVYYKSSYLSLGYSFSNFNITVTPNYISTQYNNFGAVDINCIYKTKIFTTLLNANYYDTNSLIFNKYLVTSIEFHPLFSTIRYEPFIQVKNIYIVNDGIYRISDNSTTIFAYNYDDYYEWSNSLDLQVGIRVNNFTLIWNFNNILDQKTPVLSGGKERYYHQYFQVKWRFID